ncbi:MAG: DUF4743 domain-containing protein [Proteobacteria bacterium]|nr:DUF4743 domain-containing protein [Pseudomonadota bacterium]
MGFLDHIRACNNAGDLSRFLPLLVAGRRLGWVRPAFAEALAGHPEAFAVGREAVRLAARLGDPAARTEAVEAALRALAAAGTIPGWRDERYPVVARFGEAPAFAVERAAVPFLGVRAFGVHLNGFVRKADGLHLWVGRRGADRAVAPGKLDNLVAGGQPAGLGLAENLAKECAEEAGIEAALAARARPAGLVSYLMEVPAGLKPDLLFVYDLELPAGFAPRNVDGEIAGFELWPAAAVAERIRTGDDFKFNVNLVNIDFLVRHGVIEPEREPDYAAIVRGLRTLD